MADQTGDVSSIETGLSALANLSAEGLATALGLWSAARAAISTVASGIAAAATQTTLNEALAKYHDVPLSPALLADMVVRNIIPDSTGHAGTPPPNWPASRTTGIESHTATDEAAFSGLSGDRFAAMALDTGESYGIIDALRLWNRKKNMWGLAPNPNYPTSSPYLYHGDTDLGPTYGIEDAQLYKVIAYSRTRNEFISDFEKLAKNTLSPADAVELAVKQIVDTNTARNLFTAAGGLAEQFDALVAASGDSMGVEKASELHRLGLISDQQLHEILGLSRLNPRFYPLVPLLAHKELPVYELRVAVQNGTMDAATAISRMEHQGYDTADAALFIAAVAEGTIGAAKAESESMVLTDWEAGLITEAEATKALSNLGEKDWAIPFILDTVMARKVLKQRTAVETRLRASVLFGETTPAAAKNYLVQLGWDAGAAQSAVNAWVIEAETPHELLSTAQIGKLLEDGVVSPEFALSYWVRRGYTPDDAILLMAIYPPGEKGKYTGGPPPYQPPPLPPVEPLPPPPSEVPITELGPSGAP